MCFFNLKMNFQIILRLLCISPNKKQRLWNLYSLSGQIPHLGDLNPRSAGASRKWNQNFDKFIKLVDIVLLFTKNRSLKISPDCSGYAILQRRFWSIAIAFERKAGRVFPQGSTIPLQKEIKVNVSTTFLFG